jgi:Immunity protein 26
MAKKAKQKYVLGSIIAIPLPNGKFAYAKIFEDCDFGVYGIISDGILPLSEVIASNIVIYQASTDSAIKNGEWKVIGEEPFIDPEDAWAPPKATFYDEETNEWTVFNKPHIYHKGKTRMATLEEVRGLDIMSACNRPELLVEIIIDRVINGNHKEYKVRS